MSSGYSSSLETRVSGRGYAGTSQLPDGIKGFVCPRADSFGGRQGIIPPGVAVVRGMVPKGLRKVTNADVGRRAEALLSDKSTEEERYREYYGSGLKDGDGHEEQVLDESPAPAATGQAAAPGTGKPVRTAKAGKRVRVKKAAAGKRAAGGGDAVPAEKPAKRMFSETDDEVSADDTLDSFYAELAEGRSGTEEETDGEREEEPDRGTEDPEGLYARCHELEEYIGVLRRSLAAARARIASAETALNTARASSRRHDRIRVFLGSGQERLKIGGRGWECRVEGHIDLGPVHGGRASELVLTVTEPSYASELIGTMPDGDVVILSASGRTYCTYSGICDKLYGDSDSHDFIACFRFAIRDDDGGSGHGGQDYDGEAEQDD